MLDTNGVVTSANASAAPLLNIPPGESVGKQLSEISASDEFTEYVDGLLRRSAEVAEREIALAPDGKRDAATHRLHCEHLENEDLATVGLLVTLTDQRHVNVVRRSQHDFVDHLVHELRTPMTSIQASAEMMIDDENTDLDSRREIALNAC